MNPYLAGFLIGDGCQHRLSNGAYAVWVDQSLKNKVYVEKLIKKMQCYGKTYVYEYMDRTNKVHKIRLLVYSKKFYSEILTIKQNITKFIEELGEEDLWSFLSGLLDSDGTVTGRIVFYSSSKELLEALSVRLNTHHVRTHIYRFGKIFGLQIHDKNSLITLSQKLSSSKLGAPARLKNIGSRKTERL